MATRTYAVPGLGGDFGESSGSGAVYGIPGGAGDIDVGGFVPPPPGSTRPWRRPDLLLDETPEEPFYPQLLRNRAPPVVTPPVVVVGMRRRVELMEIATAPEDVDIWYPQGPGGKPKPTRPKKMRPYLQLNS